MGAEAVEQPPRRFCALYTANGMSLPKAENGLDEWSWFPTAEREGEFVFGRSTEPLSPFRKQLSFMGGLHHPSGPKADPHTCSDMWLTGAPLHNPNRGTYNTVALDQVVALHTKQYCRQPSLVLSIDAGTASFPVRERFPTTWKAGRSRLRTTPAACSTGCSAATARRSSRNATS